MEQSVRDCTRVCTRVCKPGALCQSAECKTWVLGFSYMALCECEVSWIWATVPIWLGRSLQQNFAIKGSGIGLQTWSLLTHIIIGDAHCPYVQVKIQYTVHLINYSFFQPRFVAIW